MSARPAGRWEARAPSWEIGASVGLHLALVALALLGQRCAPEPSVPLIDPSKVIQVQAVALPKQTSALPDRPSRTPDPPRGATREPDAPPPPPRQSEMTLKKEDAPKPRGEDKPRDRTSEREALLNAARREALVKDPNAPLGEVDRPRTDPNGVDPQDAIFGAGSGTIDPELARYIASCRQAILPHWTPLPATIAARPDLKVEVLVAVGADGRMGESQIYKTSGDSGFDRSAVLALAKTGRLPPPPARFRESAGKGVLITLAARDLQ